MAVQGASSGHFSFRIPAALRERLERAARGAPGASRSQLAVRLIDEGLRMDGHPGIVFRAGPMGRRPALAGGPDVWEVARVLREYGRDEDGLARTAEVTGLTLAQSRAVSRYYGEFRSEIDEWIERVDAEAEGYEVMSNG